VFDSITAKRPATRRMPSPKPVPVTMRTLLQRINRKLRMVSPANGGARQLRRGRGRDAGGFYIFDVAQNQIMAWGIDPEETGRRMGVLASGQMVVNG
jgi:hypothetical protein